MKTANDIVFQGTPQQVADSVFKQIIAPMYKAMEQHNPLDAEEFAFVVVGMAAGGYINSASDMAGAKNKLMFCIEALFEELQAQRQAEVLKQAQNEGAKPC